MFLKRLSAISLLLLCATGTQCNAQESKNRIFSTMPGSKMAIEVPLKRLISTGSSPLMERPQPALAGAEGRSLPALAAGGSSVKGALADSRLEGRHVQAGLVDWAPNAATAYQRSRLSGKPVLVFQMIGKLDDEFC